MSYGKWLKRLKRIAARSRLYPILKRIKSLASPARTFDYSQLRQTGYIPIPTSFTFEPTLKCNLRCKMCYQNEYRDGGVKPELDLNGMKRIFQGFGHHFRHAYLVGGEVFLRRDFEELLGFLEMEQIQVFLTTNGTVLPVDRITHLRRFRNLVGMWFSIDGIGEINDAIRGPRSFERTLKSLQEAKRFFEVGTSFVIMQDNVDQMVAYAELMAELGIIEVNFQHEIFATPEEVAETQAMLDWKASELMVYVRQNSRSPAFMHTLRTNLERLAQLERERRIVVSFEPPVANQRLEEFYDGTLRRHAHLFCREMTNLRIDPQGNVIFCPYLRRSFGNLFEQPLEEIWNSSTMRQFRVKLIEHNLLPICQRCCKLGLWPGACKEEMPAELPTAALS